MRQIASITLLLGIIGGCAEAPTAASPPLQASGAASPAGTSVAELRTDLLAADRAHAASAAQDGPVTGFVAHLSDDATYLFEFSPYITGRDAIRAKLEQTTAPGSSLTWTPLYGDVSSGGDVGYTVGTRRLTVPGAAAPQLSKYIAFWRKQGDGRWTVEAYMQNLTRPEFAELPAGFPPEQDNGVKNFTATDVAATKAALLAVDAAFAALSVAENASVAFARYAAPDAVVLVGAGPFSFRRHTIAAGYQTDDANAELSWAPAIAGAGTHGDLGYTIGNYVATGTRPDGSIGKGYGKYLSVWEKSAAGEWQFVADGGNPSPPPAQ